MLKHFISQRAEIRCCDETVTVRRTGWRSILADICEDSPLWFYVGGFIPYHYREPDKIAKDLRARLHAFGVVADMGTKAPTDPKFQRSHFGEILSAVYVEEVLGFRRLYSKLTLTTAENTNVHKMDAFFVNVSRRPFEYLAVEAKTSVQPLSGEKFSGHRNGMLRHMLASMSGYSVEDRRFDYVAIRDHLEEEEFTIGQQRQIRRDLGPHALTPVRQMGIAVINRHTVNSKDDNFILSADCAMPFDYEALAVTDLVELARCAYERLNQMKALGRP